ncbi:serine/threonine protein kinase [Ghiorsea bivora]|uniref:serine/threonine protein kinase n=1 Tax=Ghiorsea bivora TaxID=1485545 RepID=UPI00068B5088|nr:serine/threonine-protein kinase [Ghiorsea bivora]
MSYTPKQNQPSEDITHLGSYIIESRLGQGGMGVVYRAIDKELGRPVAIKVLHPHLLRHENLKQRFRREARMHAKVMHPNIVTLLSLFEDETHMALIMELIEGEDLKAYLKSHPDLSLEKKLSIAIDVLTGLEAAHHFDMVHRDLKPANVLVSNKGEVKLLDFGLAKPEQGEDDLTQSGATVGSFRYMAPEQILNKPIDARTDLYAFGILLFYMVLGKLPFDASSNGGEFEIMEKQVREPAPIPNKLEPSIPPALSDLILKLLSKSKHSRPESAAVVRDKIVDIMAHLKPVPTKTRKSQQSSSSNVSKTSIILPPPSNAEVAQQWIQHGKEKLYRFWLSTFPKLQKLFSGLSGIAFLFIALGALVIAVLTMAEKTASPYPQKTSRQEVKTQTKPALAKKEIAKMQLEQPSNKQTKTSKPLVAKQSTKTVSKPKKEVAQAKKKKTAQTKKVNKPKKEKVTAPVLLTKQVRYTVTRSDKSKALPSDKHEFKGGNHVFFQKSFRKNSSKTHRVISRTGESKLVFDQPQVISKIILHKASVGRADFSKGYVYLEIKPANGFTWKRIFERKGDDVDIQVTINDIIKIAPLIQAIRIRFKSTRPITIGPIDILS